MKPNGKYAHGEKSSLLYLIKVVFFFLNLFIWIVYLFIFTPFNYLSNLLAIVSSRYTAPLNCPVSLDYSRWLTQPARLHSIAMCFYLSMTIIHSNPARERLPAVHYSLKMAGTIGRCQVSAISQEHSVYRSFQQHSNPYKGSLWQHAREGSSSQLSPGQSAEERPRKNLSAHEQRVFNTGVESAKHRPLKSWNKLKQMSSE